MEDLIQANLLIVVVACWVLGFSLKKTPRIPNWSIVFVLTAFAIVVCLLVNGYTVLSVLQGILVGAVAVYGKNILTQAAEGLEEAKKEE